MPLTLYRLAIGLIAPFILCALVLRVLRGRESWSDLSERLGGGEGTAPAIWLHGASNGELASARVLVETLGADLPDYPLVITANTVTGRALVRGWDLPGVSARLAPIDLRWALARFRARYAPFALVVMESELWPNRLLTQAGPAVVVGARLSKRSSRRWGSFGRLARDVLHRLTWVAPQDAASGERLLALGLPPDRLGPVANLKSGLPPSPPDSDTLRDLHVHFPRNETWLAASTHEGEEEVILRAHSKARTRRPDLRLILAPRHPNRADAIERMVRDFGLHCARRSRGDTPGKDVYLADTLGEMPLWYSLAAVTFVGGSLAMRGGHTPFEPVAFGSAILHGPDVANFTEAYARLHAAGSAIETGDADALAEALMTLGDANGAAAMADRARNALQHDIAVDAVIAQVVRIVVAATPETR